MLGNKSDRIRRYMLYYNITSIPPIFLSYIGGITKLATVTTFIANRYSFMFISQRRLTIKYSYAVQYYLLLAVAIANKISLC